MRVLIFFSLFVFIAGQQKLPLHDAAKNGRLDEVKQLVEQKVNLNQKDESGEKAVILAGKEGKWDVVKYLIEKGADWKDERRSYVFFDEAAKRNDLAMLKYFVEKGLPLTKKNDQDLTALHMAINNRKGDLMDWVKYLVGKGADVNAADYGGRTPVHSAAAFGLKDLLKYFKENDANMVAEDRNGMKPIDLARKENHTEAVAYLESISK